MNRNPARRVLPLAALALAAFAVFSAASSLVTNTEDFSSGNTGAWSFNVASPEFLESDGGNPGAWLFNPNVVSFAPILTTTSVATFNSNFRAAGVTRLSIDAQTISASAGANGFQFSLLLRDSKGTPNLSDDDFTYFVADEVPLPGNGWKNFDFQIPSGSTLAVPSGWSGGYAADPTNFRTGVDWNDVITSVDRVEWWWIDPSLFAVIQTWRVGVDNITIETGGALAIPRNGSGVNPVLLQNLTPPALGTTWQASVDCTGFAFGLAVLIIHAGPASGPVIGAGELLVNLATPRLLGIALLHGGGSVTFGGPIPNNISLCGLMGYVQGACTGAPGAQLTNALDLQLGS